MLVFIVEDKKNEGTFHFYMIYHNQGRSYRGGGGGGGYAPPASENFVFFERQNRKKYFFRGV
jgi:hypothetical protein